MCGSSLGLFPILQAFPSGELWSEESRVEEELKGSPSLVSTPGPACVRPCTFPVEVNLRMGLRSTSENPIPTSL